MRIMGTTKPPKGVIATKEIDGRKFDVTLTDGGRFRARFEEEWIEAPSLQGLTEKLRKKVRAAPVKVALPLTKIETASRYRGEREVRTIKVTQITVVGSVQSGRYRIYATYVEDKHPDREPKTLNGYHDTTYRRLSGPEIQVAVDLYNAYQKAQAAWADWKRANQVEALEELRKEQERLASQPTQKKEQTTREAEEAEP